MAAPVSTLCSMATRALLTELAAGWDGAAVVEAVGGVDAARRVRDGEAVDVVVLSDSVARALAADGFLLSDSLIGIAASGIAVAVRDGGPVPELGDAEAVQRAVLAAGRIGYSTGPSGDHLRHLLDGWGIRDTLGDRLVQAPPGVPVGRLLAEGAVDLAFQQRSELLGLPGVTVAGPLPPAIQSTTIFTAGVARAARQPDAGQRFVAFLASTGADAAKHRLGLAPV